ncbi:MAG TPA: tetratricopeptide repeat protein [bacterium]
MSSIFFLLFFLEPNPFRTKISDYSDRLRYVQLEAKIEPTWQTDHELALYGLLENRSGEVTGLLEKRPYRTTEDNYLLGIACYRLGEYERARYFLELARMAAAGMHLSERFQYVDYYLGLLFIKEQRLDKARSHFSGRVPLSEPFDPIWFFDGYDKLVLARQKIAEGDYAGARDIYAGVSDFFGYRELGLARVYEGLGELDSARRYCDTVVQYVREEQLVLAALSGLGRVSYAQKDYGRAAGFFKRYYAGTHDAGAAFMVGLCLSNEGKYDSAGLYFRELPDTVDDYLFYQGRTDYFRGQWGGAEEKLLRHREFFPGSKHADRGLYILGTINYKRKEYQPAVEFYQDLVNLYPASQYAASAMKTIADAYYSQAEYKQALVSYRKVRDYQPSVKMRGETALRIYETMFYLEKFSSMTAALHRFIEVNTDSVYAGGIVGTVRLRIAKMLNKDGEYYQSMVELDKLFAAETEPALICEALVERARVARNIGNINEEKRSYGEIVNRQDNRDYHTFAVGELASIYAKATEYDSALYYYNLLLSDDESREMAMFEIARLYDALGQYSETETMADRLIADFPNSVFLVDAYLLKSRSLRQRGKYDAAVEILAALAETTSVKPEVYVEIGDIYMEIHDFQKARDSYVAAGDHYQQDRDGAAKALLSAGDAARALGDKNGARESYLRGALIAQSLSIKDQLSARLSELDEAY